MPVSERDLVSMLDTLPPELAQNMVRRAFLYCKVGGEVAEDDEVDRLVDTILIGINLFIEPSERPRIKAVLRKLTGPSLADFARVVPIRSAADALEARTQGRAIAQKLGARSLVAQRVSTVIGTLAGVLLVQGAAGTIEIRGTRTEPRVVIVAAIHPSIDCDGASRTLTEVRETVDRFEVTTGDHGARIEVQIYV
jgi:hypothetical protein